MVDLTTGILGAAGGNRPFLAGSVIWAGGAAATFVEDADFQVVVDNTVTGESCVVKGVYGDRGDTANGGAWVMTNSIYEFVSRRDSTLDARNNSPSGMTLRWTDVTVTHYSTVYSAWGAFNVDGNATAVELNNVNFYGEVNATTSEVGLAPFFGAVAATATVGGVTYTSAFNNIAYWNRQTLASGLAKGASPALTSGVAHNNPLLGPFGTDLNGSGQRAMIRFASQGTANAALSDRTMHVGVTTNMDIRAISEANISELFYIAADSGAHVRHVNPLLGQQAGIGGQFWARQFVGGSQQDVFVATNPVTTDGGDHKLTVADADIVSTGNSGVVLMPAVWDIFTVADHAFTTDTVFENVADGLMWRQLNFEGDGNNNNISGNRAAITPLTAESYRKYSWLQQPDNVTWGREIAVTPPPINATDEQVATSRTTGFDIHDGTSWTTTTNVDDPMDDAVLFTGFADAATATTGLSAVNAIATGAHVPVVVKARAYTDVTNTHTTLPYAIDGTDVNFTLSIAFDGNATGLAGTTALEFPASTNALTADTAIDRITTSGTITFRDGAFANGTNTVEFSAAQINFNSVSLLGNFTATTINNLPTTILDGSVYTGTFTSNTAFSLVVENPADVAGLTLAGTGVFTITGAEASDFTDVPANALFPFTSTITTDFAGDLTIRTAADTYITRSGATSYDFTSDQLPAGTYHAIVSAAGRGGLVGVFSVSRDSTAFITSQDLAPFGYTTVGIDIGTARSYARVTYEGRPTIQSTENGISDFLDNNLRSVRWFGDLWGQEAMREVVLENFVLNSLTDDPFTLNAANNVTSINHPTIRALHGTAGTGGQISGELEFQADPAAALGVDADYRMTDGINVQVTSAAGGGVSAVVSDIALLTGTITANADRTINSVNGTVEDEADRIIEGQETTRALIGNEHEETRFNTDLATGV